MSQRIQTPSVDGESTWHKFPPTMSESPPWLPEQAAGNAFLIHPAAQGLQTPHPLEPLVCSAELRSCGNTPGAVTLLGTACRKEAKPSLVPGYQTNKGSLFGACLSDIREVSEMQTLEALDGASFSRAGTPGQPFPTLEVTGDIQE